MAKKRGTPRTRRRRGNSRKQKGGSRSGEGIVPYVQRSAHRLPHLNAGRSEFTSRESQVIRGIRSSGARTTSCHRSRRCGPGGRGQRHAGGRFPALAGPGYRVHRLWGGDKAPRFPDDGTEPAHHTYFPAARRFPVRAVLGPAVVGDIWSSARGRGGRGGRVRGRAAWARQLHGARRPRHAHDIDHRLRGCPRRRGVAGARRRRRGPSAAR